MSRSPVSVAVLVVFVTGGVVGGGTAALLMRAATPPSPVGAQLPRTPTLTQSARTQSADRAAVRAPEQKHAAARALQPTEQQADPAGALGHSLDEDPGTGAWLADSLAQLEEKYQAMKQRGSALTSEAVRAEPLPVDPARDDPAAQHVEDPFVLNEPAPLPAAQAAQPPLGDPLLEAEAVPAASGPGNYIAQAAITQNNTSTTNVTQVNQTLLVGYLPLLVPVPVAPGSTGSTPAPSGSQLTARSWTGLSPWAPIDMSRHHNPWGNSALR